MDVKSRIFCLKVLICLLYPVSRVKKIMRKTKTNPLKIAASIMLGCFFVLTYLLYLNWKRITIFDDTKPSSLVITTSSNDNRNEFPMQHKPLNEISHHRFYYNDTYYFDEEKLMTLIDTPGCKIPVQLVEYGMNSKNTKKFTETCGKRAVFLKKVDGDKVQALIKPKIIKTYLRKSVTFDCCYRFISRSPRNQHYGKKIKFTKCVKFQENAIITLETDFVNVQCFEYDKRNISHAIYDDVYAFTKRRNIIKKSHGICKQYNVLMIGIDSMSLPRLVQTLKNTANFFADNSWFCFRGYHKVADNTFPNLMAFLAGRNLSDIASQCANKMDECNRHIIWNKFKEAGYVTAYGEDYLRIPDTFTDKYAFETPPTDHYMRPFFLKGETQLNMKTLICAGKMSSGQQVLNYALDFANTYKNDDFFGLFWMNSFSHHPNSRPQDSDGMIVNFLNQLTYTGVLETTFVIMLSDHGIRFGEHRLQVAAYHDERLPYMFILPSSRFVRRFPLYARAMFTNQYRLVTPYDLHHTLLDIHRISCCQIEKPKVVLSACPNCHSMFQVANDNRTCQDVAIHDKWCSCHNLYPLTVQDSDGVKSVQMAVSHLKQIAKATSTKRCYRCAALSLENIIRIHFYYHEDKTSLYYVVAFTMTPGNSAYEAIIYLKDGKRSLVGPISVLSPYRGSGSCTNKRETRVFCWCEKTKC